MQTPKRIEICGGIASGKTSLAKLLDENLASSYALYENFGANPFLEAFYSDVQKFSFETEITFLLQHFSAIKAAPTHAQSLICDYSFVLDQAYAEFTLDESQRHAFMAVHEEVNKYLQAPHLLIYLKCSADVALERTRARKRSVEDSITIEYLDTLYNSVATQVDAIRDTINVVEIDTTEVDYVHSMDDALATLYLIKSKLS